MKKKIFINILIILFFVCFSIVSFSCNKKIDEKTKTNPEPTKTSVPIETQETEAKDNNDLDIINKAYSYIITLIPMEATSNLFLIDSYQGVTFIYKSNNEEVLSSDGVINNPESDVFVTLEITCTYNETIVKKNYIICVRANSSIDEGLESDKNVAKGLLYDSLTFIDETLYSDTEIDELNRLIEKYVVLIDDCTNINEINNTIEEFYSEFNTLYNDLEKYIESALRSILEYYESFDYSDFDSDDLDKVNNLYNEYQELIENEITSANILRLVNEFKDRLDDLYLSLSKVVSTDLINATLPGYYDSLDRTLIGNALKLELRYLITSTHTYKTTYDNLRTMTAKSDADPDRSGYLITIYSRQSVKAAWDGGTTWNREHVWPQSMGWFKTSDAGSDLHHVRPETPSVNSSRGNKPFGVQTNSSQYYPGDEAKGDVARIIFYLLTRYPESDNYSITNVCTSMDLLLKWNMEDPVDDFERNRNEVTYGIQGNRNPFIDYANFANIIWGKIELNTSIYGDITITVQINFVIIEELHKDYYAI